MKLAAIFGLAIGVALILASIFKPAMLNVVQATSEQYVRLSGIIIGALFVVLAILTLSGTLGSP